MFGLLKKQQVIKSPFLENIQYSDKSNVWTATFSLPSQKPDCRVSIHGLSSPITEEDMRKLNDYFECLRTDSVKIKEDVLQNIVNEISDFAGCKPENLEFVSFNLLKTSKDERLIGEEVFLAEVNTNYLGGHWLMFTLDEQGKLIGSVGLEG